MDKSNISYLERWKDKICTAEEAVMEIKNGQHLFVGSACATPRSLTKALELHNLPLEDVELFHFLTSGMLIEEHGSAITKFRHRSFFVGSDIRDLVNEGAIEYVPVPLSQVPLLMANGRFRVDTALIQVSTPDEFGYVSLGVSVDIVMAAVRNAKYVIAEVNPSMPRTLGESFIHVNDIDKLVPVDTEVIEFLHEPLDEIAQQIAQYVAGIIEDGSTLQIGLGRIPNESLKYLKTRRDLGIHSDVITDSILELIDEGVITGARKTLHPYSIVTSYCIGSKKLYDAIDNNPLFSFNPIEEVADAGNIRKNYKMVSLAQAFSVDLTGQVCTDQFAGEFYGGVSAQMEFLRGASLSPGGKPIICLRSTTPDESESCIRPLLPMGEGVSVARSDVHYIVTEYGIAYLFGKSIRERAIALIEIAHPKFRQSLLEEAKKLGYALEEQKLETQRSYLVEEERTVTIKNGKQILIRPAKASDVMEMKDVFYQMSQHDVYTRFFHRLNVLSFEDAQKLCTVNFDTEVAFVAVTGSRDNETIIGSGCYFLNPSSNIAEVAYMITSEWQGTGLGSVLQQRMMEFAKSRGIRGFIAEILAENSKMIALAKKSCENITVQRDGDTVDITMYFDGN